MRQDNQRGARELLGAVERYLRRYIVLGSKERYTAVALWVLHTHAVDAAEVTPYLNVTSPEKRSGKSRLLELLAAVARNALHVSNLSEAALFRVLDTGPTLLIDEIDALFKSGAERTEALRGIVNSGNRRGARVLRCAGPNQDVRGFEVFGPKVLAGIDTGALPDTIRDRSVTIRLHRKAPDESVERLLWQRIRPATDKLHDALAGWGAGAVDALREHEPGLLSELDDRAMEAWWPLLSIADLAGGEWPERARTAAKALSASDEHEDESRGVRLLGDLRGAFGDRRAMLTQDVLDALNGLDEQPWGSWHEGAGLRPRDLARLLRPFGIKSKDVRDGAATGKGYHRDDLEGAWDRYLVNKGRQGRQGRHSAPHAALDVADVADVADNQPVGPEGPAVDPDVQAWAERLMAEHGGVS